MKITESKIVDYEIAIIHHEAILDGDGNVITEAYDEENKKPIYGLATREETEEEIATREAQEKAYLESVEYKQSLIDELKTELASYDYIGVKIAMGVATKEDYADKIAYTEELRQKIRELED